MTTSAIRFVEQDDDLVHIVLEAPPGNVIDADMVRALRAAVSDIARSNARAVIFEGAGKHFSFGASVEEHLPAGVAQMLGGLHDLMRELHALRRPLIAAVRGQCLGAGLEIAAFCHRVIATPDAVLGQPEIRLGVFAPVASVVLPMRIGQAAADHLLLGGGVVKGAAAMELGLVDALADDPAEAALAHARKHWVGKSLPALQHACEAARWQFGKTFLEGLDHVERLYLNQLMSCHDPVEGLTAFLEKREAVWTHA